MGGSGGGGSYSGTDEELARTREQVRRELEQQQLTADINQFLAEQLAGYNERDTRAVEDKLDQIEEALRERGHEVDRLLFGGSVAKHTYVNGLSDVDSLVYLDGPRSGSPAEVLTGFAAALRAILPPSAVSEIAVGRMAVTVTYQDGTQVQLLPATERGEHTVIPSPNGTDWKAVRPHKFTQKLTESNRRNGNGVVPAIKIAKALIDGFPRDQRLSGYHVEALAVDAFKTYNGPRDRASMLHHLLRHAADAVLRPTGDITGQTVHIDEHLGRTGSPARRNISRSLRAIETALASASSEEQYRHAFESD
jgi:hypothetical protein